MSQNEVQIGSRVAVMVRGREIARGVVVSIEEPARKMTGGRGIAVEGKFSNGSKFQGDGWDANQLQSVR